MSVDRCGGISGRIDDGDLDEDAGDDEEAAAPEGLNAGAVGLKTNVGALALSLGAAAAAAAEGGTGAGADAGAGGGAG
jgi:hypothetical protein